MENVEGNYIKDFDATVTKRKKDYVALDQTAFYPEGGGQPSDTGFLEWNDKKARVKQVIKKGDTVKHILDGELPEVNTKVHGIIDWEKRFGHMKMHTAQHILSGIIFDKYQARTVGNQIHADYSRVDFDKVRFSDDDLKFIEEKFNEIVSKNLPVKIYEEERASLEKRVDSQRAHLDLLPSFVKKLRIIEIKDFDICPCAGTHVKNTSEIPKIDKIKRETKGKDRERIIYSLQS
jgi:misacylated tRNA(Ala) deacylase